MLDESAVPEVSPLALSILELLNEGPMHPYELASTMRTRHHDEFIRLNFGSLYHTVDVLERNGWIVPVEREKEGRRPERTIYRLTDAGHSVLVTVISDILARPRREYPYFAAGLMFMHHLAPDEAVEHLRRRAVMLSGVIAKLSHILQELLTLGHHRLHLIELEHKIAMLEAERVWVLGVADEIINGKLEWKGGIPAAEERLRSGHGTGAH